MKLPSLLLCLGLWSLSPGVGAWSNHSVGSYLALQDLPALRDAPQVQVETLEQFLSQQYAGLVALLDEQENFARSHFPDYPPRPDNLRLALVVTVDPGTMRNLLPWLTPQSDPAVRYSDRSACDLEGR